MFGKAFLFNWQLIVLSAPITFFILGSTFLFYNHIAVFLRQRFPADGEFFKRTMVLIFLYLTMSALVLLLIFSINNWLGWLDSESRGDSFMWAYVVTGILNIFVTFLNEGIYRFESWKKNLAETEQLKMTYKQSQLIGLKSQINPHFLFNSLNSLSGLIQEDTDKAEKFLDEMSKVYRYMLRNDEEQLVTLRTEIPFILSYFSLLKSRYGAAVELHMMIDEKDKEKFIPPLSLQVLLENAIFHNKTSKTSPLKMRIESSGKGSLHVRNNIQKKIITDTTDQETGLDNLIKKYQLMGEKALEINDTGEERNVILPLIEKVQEGAL
jgi:LytS/YehU family sensor histidine kinase